MFIGFSSFLGKSKIRLGVGKRIKINNDGAFIGGLIVAMIYAVIYLCWYFIVGVAWICYATVYGGIKISKLVAQKIKKNMSTKAKCENVVNNKEE